MSFLIGILTLLILAISLFMILLVLIQRGRGGGLAGAFGGMGGQSAFGTRAGDMFTRITVVFAVVWVLLAGGLGIVMRNQATARDTGEQSIFDNPLAAETVDADSADAPAKKADVEFPDPIVPEAPAPAGTLTGPETDSESTESALPSAESSEETPQTPNAAEPEQAEEPGASGESNPAVPEE